MRFVLPLSMFFAFAAVSPYSTNAGSRPAAASATALRPVSPGEEAGITQSISVRWELLANFYQNKHQVLSRFTFTNHGKTPLPASGWALYYNSVSAPQLGKTASGFLIQDLSGCLFRMTPTADFKGIAPGDSIQVDFVSTDDAATTSDAPEGLYLVWDDHPDKGISVGKYTKTPITNPAFFNRYPGDRIPEATPEVVYDTNSVIRDIPGPRDQAVIFPTPVSMSTNPGSATLGSRIVFTDAAFGKDASYLSEVLERRTGHKLLAASITDSSQGEIRLVKSAIQMPAEGYRLDINQRRILIEASDPAGIFYGIQTLLGSLGAKTPWTLPAITVTDYPRFAYRSVLIDVGRNFQPIGEIRRVVDLMAFCKLNVLHLHLTDDEGWRLEIPGLPELTTVGARRGHTLDDHDFLRPCYGSGPDTDSKTGSGFYTRAEFIDLLRYANDRHIRVVPEIESPGHARAAVKSMDNRYRRLMTEGKPAEALQYLLRDTADQSVYSTPQLYHDDVMNVALPSVYNFIGKVVDEITKMYQEAGVPLETIHLGGDEVPVGVWEKSPACTALIQSSPTMRGVGDLWYYYFHKADSILKEKGLYVSAWEEAGMRKTLLDGKPRVLANPDFAGGRMQVHIWNNGDGAEDLAYRMANGGYKVVLAVASNLYFDMSYNKSFDEFGYYWATFADVDKAFGYLPYDFQRLLTVDNQGFPLPAGLAASKEKLTDYGKSNIVGLEGCLWGETVRSPQDLEYKLLPKLLGMAERAWSPDPAWANTKDTLEGRSAYTEAWSQFANTLGKKVLPYLDTYNGGYAYRIPTAGGLVKDGLVLVNVQLPGMVIRYTTDGKEPDVHSRVYAGPIKEKGRIRLRVFDTVGRGGRTVEVLNP